jgi:two-component system chemotaxis response regulator CheB
VLTGGLDDGTAGLWTIKQLGGIAVVQDPADALERSMPSTAIRHVQVDHVVALSEIAPLLNRLVRVSVHDRPTAAGAPLSTEVRIAQGSDPKEAGVHNLGTPSMFACPECHGVLLEVSEGGRVRYRCHTGHAYSLSALRAEQNEQVEATLYSAMRALEERLMLLERLVERASDGNDAEQLRREFARAREAAAAVRNLIRSSAPATHDEPNG